MTYEQAIQYIYETEWKGSILGLSRMEALMEKLGQPQLKTKVIHIAGTNGKGSTAKMLADILTATGYKTGLYISPSIRTFEERMQVNAIPISKEHFIECVEILKEAIEQMDDAPTEYERITALAFIYFAKKECDFAVIETGLGGRLDATNVVHPVLSIITTIGMDHVAELGDTLEKIASEKAGIIKPNVPVVAIQQDPRALGVLEERAKEKHAPFYIAAPGPTHPESFTDEKQVFSYGNRKHYELGLLGLFQLQNVGLVLTAVDVLKLKCEISESAVKNALKKTEWLGRFEVVHHDPLIIIDAAHNPQGAESLKENLQYYFPEKKMLGIFGVLADKGYNRIVETMLPHIDKWIAVTPNNPRALPAKRAAEVIREKGGVVTVTPSVQDAMKVALSEKTDGICIFGSLTILNDVYSYLEN